MAFKQDVAAAEASSDEKVSMLARQASKVADSKHADAEITRL